MSAAHAVVKIPTRHVNRMKLRVSRGYRNGGLVCSKDDGAEECAVCCRILRDLVLPLMLDSAGAK